MSWYNRYMTALGDYSVLPNSLFLQIISGVEGLRKGDSVDVSIVVIAYNEESRLTACLWSLSELQSRYSVEIVVVDNASKDRTAEIIERCGVVSVFQPLQGVGHARQAGLEASKGRFVISVDADTLYPPYYVDTMVGRLQKPNISAVLTTYWFIPDGQKSWISLDFYSLLRDFVTFFRAIKRPELIAGGAALAFYSADALKVGWKTDIRRGEDGSMVLGLKKFGRVELVLSPKTRIRSTSRTLDADGDIFKMIFKRVAREFKRFGAYFRTKKQYKDQNYNKL